MTRYITCADTAKLLRAALKKNFPGVKFSVRSSTYSGGASIDIGWTDGPTQKMVDTVATQFQGASFDGMIDLKSYHDSVLDGEKVHFGADYVHSNRSLSVGVLEQIGAEAERKYGIKCRISSYGSLDALSGNYSDDRWVNEVRAGALCDASGKVQFLDRFA